MAAAAVENPSKSQLKKKARAEAAAAASAAVASSNNGHPDSASVSVADRDDSADGRADAENLNEHPYVRELHKQIRNITKKLAAMQKTDSIIEANPGVSLDDLVAQRKLNNDQKASALKKPGLHSQRAQIEEQIQTYRQIDSDYKARLVKQKEELSKQHRQELDDLKEQLEAAGAASGAGELRKSLLIFTQFLRAAAHKRSIEEEAESQESKAFEGALLKVYGGDAAAVQTALNIIVGSSERVPGIDEVLTNVPFSQVNRVSQEHGPATDEEWASHEQGASTGAEIFSVPPGSDPTVTHAGLTELDATGQVNGAIDGSSHNATPSGVQGTLGDEGGNVAGERWEGPAGAEKRGMEDSYEMIPRPSDEVDVPAAAPSAVEEAPAKTSWADESIALDNSAPGNQAGESWASAAPAEQAAPGWGDEPAEPMDDGYQQVSNKRGGRGRGRGDGEFRGGRGRGGPRGGGARGDGERGRGGRGGGRGGFRGDGERGRGRGGRGRGDGPRDGPRS